MKLIFLLIVVNIVVLVAVSGQAPEQAHWLTFIGQGEDNGEPAIYRYPLEDQTLVQGAQLTLAPDSVVSWVGDEIAIGESDPEAYGVPFFRVRAVDFSGAERVIYETFAGSQPPRLIVSPEGRYAVAYSVMRGGNAQATVIDMATMEDVCGLGYGSGGLGMQWVDDNHLLYTSIAEDHLVEVSACQFNRLEAVGGTRETILSKGETLLWLTSDANGFYFSLSDLQGGSFSQILTLDVRPSNVTFSADGAQLAWETDGQISVWDSGQSEPKIFEGTQALWLPDGLLFRNVEGALALWDDGVVWEQTIPLTGRLAQRVSASPHGMWLAVVDSDGHIHILDAQTGEVVDTIDTVQVMDVLAPRWTVE